MRKVLNLGKTIVLEKDVDKDNKECPLNCKAMWTQLINPETGEMVEAKIYAPEGLVQKILIICPGYRGDFVLQERSYADDFCKDGRAIVCLRHNGLRVVGEDVVNYVHCPERQRTWGRYTGKGPFSVKKANRELLIALKAIVSTENFDVDIIGHSWGGQIVLESLKALKELRDPIVKKVKNVILLGAMLDSRPETYTAYRDFFLTDAQQDFFREMDARDMVEDFLDNARDMGNFTSGDISENVRITIINSSADKEIDIRGEQIPFHGQIDDSEARWIFFRFDDSMVTLGGRLSEGHDYVDPEVRDCIREILEEE